jgi:Putative cyclase
MTAGAAHRSDPLSGAPPEHASNWGRWGDTDERGALNRITPSATQRGIGAVRTGVAVALGLPLRSGHGPVADRRPTVQHFMVRDGGDYAAGLGERGFGFADDTLVLPTGATTHLDALAHVWAEHTMWNGFSASGVTSRGASHCGIDKAGPIVTRALFVDAGPPNGGSLSDDTALTAEDLQRYLDAAGVRPESGDALLVRTGWLARWRAGTATAARWAGLDPSCAAWLDEQGFALIGADNIAVEAGPSADPDDAAPLHVALIRDRGIPLLELMDLEELAATGRAEFLLVVASLRLVGGVASPVNPVAVL